MFYEVVLNLLEVAADKRNLPLEVNSIRPVLQR
jgi:hypothetical protein